MSAPSTSPLIPSSSFQVPENPGLSKTPEIVAKILRSNTLTSGYVYHRKKDRHSHLGSELAQDTGIKPAGLRSNSWESTTSPGKGCQGLSPHKASHQQNSSWSPIPASNPEPIQPTVDLSSEQIFPLKRKMLLRTKLRLHQLPVTASTQQSCVDEAPGTSQSFATAVHYDLSPSSPPKSAPVSPSFLSSKKLSSLASDAKCLSHNNLADFNFTNEISDISHGINSMASKSSVDGQSHLADKGGFSDISSSDGEQKVLCDSGRSSSMDEDVGNRRRGSSDEEDDRKRAPVREPRYGERPVDDRPGRGDFEKSINENLLHGGSQKDSSPMIEEDSFGELEDKEEKGCEGEGKRPSSHEEELLDILKKWYKQGYGEKGDLVKALMLTGHQKSAHK